MYTNRLTTRIIQSGRIYYGWIVLAVSSFCYFFSGPGQTYFISIFINNYIQDFGWSRSMISSLYSIATLLAGLLLFLVGRYADKHGQKKSIIIIAAILGISCLWNRFIASLWMLFLGFFVGRLAGQGSMTLLPSTVVPHWFVEKRAFAFSIMSMGGVIGSALIPPFNNWLINSLGWNVVWRLWSGLLWFVLIPIVILFLYDKPQEIGLLPDNKKNAIEDLNIIDRKHKKHSWSLKDAMNTRSFWGMIYCQSILPMITTGVVFHFISIFGSKGLPSTTAAFILSLLAIVSFPTTLIAGHFLDRIKIHYVAAFISLLELIGLTVLLFSNSIHTAIVFTVIQGSAMGLQSVCGGVVWPDYYGTKHLGSIRGLAMTATVLASALGPIPFGISFDIFYDYNPAILIMMLFATIGIIAAFLSPKPVTVTN